MSVLRVREANTWVATGRKGAVRVGDLWVPYGAPGFVDERFAFPAPPALPDVNDAQRTNLGTAWTTTAPGSWIGNTIYSPSGALPDVSVLAFNDGSGLELARKTVTAPPAAAAVDVLFDNPVQVVAGVRYLAVYSGLRYVATPEAGMTWPYTTERLTTATPPSRWGYGAIGSRPANQIATGYHVSPIVRFSTGPPGDEFEALAWPVEPQVLDGDDGQFYNLGTAFHLDAGRPCYGARWRTPTNTPAPGGPHSISLWNRVTQERLAWKQFVAEPGGYQNILWDDPIPLDAAPAEYVISVWTWHYTFRPSAWPVESPTGNLRATAGLLSGAPESTFPAATQSAFYYLSPLVGV